MINILGHQYPASTTIEDQNLICSQRYVHLKFIILSLMHKKRMIYLLLWIKMTRQICDECCVFKRTMKSLKHDLLIKSKQKLKIVHSGVCGLFKVKSVTCNCYFLIHRVYVDLIDIKEWSIHNFKKCKSLVEKYGECDIKRLIIGRGGDKTSTEFANYVRKKELSIS